MQRTSDADVVIIGGGPAGACLGAMLARDGQKVLIVERDVHPRNHVGEALTPSTNRVFHELGFLEKMEDAGFAHKEGVGWTAPRSRPGKFASVRTSDYPAPDAVQSHSYNVERDLFDSMLLRHAFELGSRVVQGVTVRRVLFDDDRAVGVRLAFGDLEEQEVRARVVVDASGRRCLLANQLGLRRKDPLFNQFAIYSWFRDIKPDPSGFEGFIFLHFLGLERAWAWHIPLRNGVYSMGVVTDKADFQKSGKSHDQFFGGLIARNRTFSYVMEDARRIRPWWIEGDYSYAVERFVGPGWMLVGDALRFVDPIFSSGVDVALYSAKFAHEAIMRSFRQGGEEEEAFGAYERRVSDGVDVWYELTDLFYRLQHLFSRFTMDRMYREEMVRTLQGNPYMPDAQARARRLIGEMRFAYEGIMANPKNLLRPWALDPARSGRT